MKIQMLALPLVGLMASGALAQTLNLPPAPKTPASSTTEPAAAKLLSRAISTYKDATGLSFSVNTAINGKQAATSTIRFARPNMLSIEQGSGAQARRFLITGKDFYVVQGTSYRKQDAPALKGGQLLEGTSAAAGSVLAALLDGKNPVAAMQSAYSSPPFQGFQGRTTTLPATVVDGDVLSGVQSTISFKVPSRTGGFQSLRNQTTMWFGGSPLTLRRVQSIFTQNGKSTTVSEKIVNQQVSPTFADDTFKFNDTGLKLASTEEQDESYFDSRLKTGADPLAFEAKSLDGATITPAKYKGKVLLMDFWATWCGPCVASLPELKGAYDKYHAQGLEVVGISLDEDKKALTSFITAKKMPWPQIFDGKGWNAAVPGVYGVKAIPFMLIIGKDGKIASVNPRGNIDAAVKAALAAS